MILGIGTDVVEVSRMEQKISNRKDFLTHVFSKNEIHYCEKVKNKYESYAARFAAKEAFLKALGTGLLVDCAPNEIEVENNSNGKPGLKISSYLNDRIKETFQKESYTIHLSLSHTSQVAIAFIIIESQ